MAKVPITTEIDLELRKHVELAAAACDRTVGEWIEELVRREVSDDLALRADAERGKTLPPEFNMPLAGAKPHGSKTPLRLRGTGGTVADAVIEDRR